jgi:2-oxoglutarate dehydrogenase E1 component
MNFSLAQPTTAAQFFHLLRRQIRRDFRKPLIVPVSKKLLKYRGAESTIEQFGTGLRFQSVIDETATDLVPDSQIKKVILCSGQIYYDLINEREKRGVKDIAIVRLEMLCPFPYRALEPQLKRYASAKVQWVQDEPKNQGAWTFVQPRMTNLLQHIGHRAAQASYTGRPISPTTATGYTKQHNAEFQAILEGVFTY